MRRPDGSSRRSVGSISIWCARRWRCRGWRCCCAWRRGTSRHRARRRARHSGADALERLVQFQPLRLDARELPAKVAMAGKHFLEAILALVEIRVRGREPGVELALLGRQRVELLFDAVELLLQRFAQVRAPLPLLSRRPFLYATIAAGGCSCRLDGHLFRARG